MSAAPTEVGGGVSQTTEALQAKLEETKISEEKPVTAEQDEQDDQDDDEAPVAGGDADKKKKKKKKAAFDLEEFEKELNETPDAGKTGETGEKEGGGGDSAPDAETWQGTDRDYTYQELLSRIFRTLRQQNPALSGEKKKYTMVPPVVPVSYTHLTLPTKA